MATTYTSSAKFRTLSMLRSFKNSILTAVMGETIGNSECRSRFTSFRYKYNTTCPGEWRGYQVYVHATVLPGTQDLRGTHPIFSIFPTAADNFFSDTRDGFDRLFGKRAGTTVTQHFGPIQDPVTNLSSRLNMGCTIELGFLRSCYASIDRSIVEEGKNNAITHDVTDSGSSGICIC
jgi:hypothetical protein